MGFDVDQPSVCFGGFSDVNGWNGVLVSSEFVANCLVSEYQRQQPGLMKGIFGQFLRSDHTRSLARKIETSSGAMWSYSTMNQYWQVVSWVLVDSDSEQNLRCFYQGLRKRYELANVVKPSFRWVDKWCCVSPPSGASSSELLAERWDDLDSISRDDDIDRSKFSRNSACREHFSSDTDEKLNAFHCLRRLGRCCSSEAHPGYSRFMALLSNAFFLINECDLEALRSARNAIGLPPEPTKEQIRKHCRMQIPQPYVLEKRVTAVMVALKDVKDSKGVPLYMDSMIKEWGLQRLHIRRGCLSDPPVDGGVLYRFTGYIHLGHVESPETKLATWQSLRGSSQLEGLHPHQAKWVTGTRVSCALFQAQGFFGVVRWNWKRAEEHMNLELPKMFDPLLTAKINSVSLEENGIKKYPDFTVNEADTGENSGVDYISSDPIRNQENEVDVTSNNGCNPEEENSIDLTLQTEVENLISTHSAVVTSSSLHLTEAQPKIPEVPQSQTSH